MDWISDNDIFCSVGIGIFAGYYLIKFLIKCVTKGLEALEKGNKEEARKNFIYPGSIMLIIVSIFLVSAYQEVTFRHNVKEYIQVIVTHNENTSDVLLKVKNTSKSKSLDIDQVKNNANCENYFLESNSSLNPQEIHEVYCNIENIEGVPPQKEVCLEFIRGYAVVTKCVNI